MTRCDGVAEAGLGAAEALAVAQRFAPLLLFHRSERHFPVDPDAFRREARLRMSNRSGRRDAGCRASDGRWMDGDHDGPEFYDMPWDMVAQATAAELGEPHPRTLDWCDDVTRPRDGRNRWRRGGGDGTRGFYLDLRNRDWLRGTGRADARAPIFFDLYRITAPVEAVALSYWFFYDYNWHVAMAHEGDWEHITVYFHPADPACVLPTFAYYAQHGGGMRVAWADVRREDTHPRAYVSTYGHPTYPAVPAAREGEWRTAWRTWEHELRPVGRQPWTTFDGAWGEVGELAASTGPLGPWFKRRTDTVTVRKR